MPISTLIVLAIVLVAAAFATLALRRFVLARNGREARLEESLAEQKLDCKRLQTLVEASRILESSLDYEKTFSELAGFLAGNLGGGCALFVAEKDELRRVGVSFSDAAVEALIERSLQSEQMSRVMRTGRAEFAGQSGLIPMPARAKIAGLLVAVPAPGASLGKNDLQSLEEIGRRAGVALEHSRLYSNARESSRLKDEFVAIVSHELRTPLTPILGAVYMLRAEPDNPKIINRALDLIERNAKAQSKIVEDLLDVSRIISGKLLLKMETVELRAVIQSAVETIRPAIEAKSIEIRLELNPLSGIVHGDAGRLQQAVLNLLANSAKFTPNGGEIIVELEDIGAFVELRVRDTGIGIRPEVLPHVFDRFRQADRSASQAHGGLGLGLSIVRHVIESHGGTVQADSSGNAQGSTFTVKLPLRDRGSDQRSIPGSQFPAEGNEAPHTWAGRSL